MKFILTGTFGELSEVRDGAHTGIDIAMETGTTLRSLTDGVVYAIRDYGNANIGKGVVIRTDDGVYHIFGHMSKINVEKGQNISGGDVLGLSGNSGHSTGPHLHFSIQDKTGEFIDPSNYIEPLMAISGDVSQLEIVNAVNMANPKGWGDWALDQYNGFADWFVGKEVEFIVKPFFGFIQELFETCWEWFVFNLPDITGYITMLAAICLIMSTMAGRGMIKPLAIYSSFLILALCILGGV